MTPVFKKPDVNILDDYGNTERDLLRYSMELLLWLMDAVNTQKNQWVRSIDTEFITACSSVLLHFDTESKKPATETIVALRDHLALWRADLDHASHPLSQLGRIMKGDPGEHLEYRGPVFLTTVDDVLEGIAHEFVAGEWNLQDEGTAHFLLTIAVVAMATIVQACYWAAKGGGHHLDVELARVFSKKDNRLALRGQLANLVVAGQALSWGCRVEFVPENRGETPDWVTSSGSQRLSVECTSSKSSGNAFNNREAIIDSIATAWQAKKTKFNLQNSPGLIATDISGYFCSREFRALLKLAHVHAFKYPLSMGLTRSIGVYDTRADFDLMSQESFNRDVIGVLASALHSRDARERGILGFMAYQGQQLLIDTINGIISRPQRGILAWSGSMGDAALLELAIKLAQPACPNVITPPAAPPIYAFLV